MKFPKSTIVNRFVSKEKFYSKTKISNKLRQQFTDEIEKITWVNKISTETLNLSESDYKELQVFEIRLKSSDISINVLKHIDTFIPYPILFLIKKETAIKAAISYKEQNLKKSNEMKVNTYFQTTWQKDLDLKLNGRSVVEIYANFIEQIEPSIKIENSNNLREAILLYNLRQDLVKQIEQLDKKISNEISVSKRQDLARERYELKKKLA
jgi:hypothetical protein